MKNILHRIKQIADNEGINITSLEKNIGASKGVISRALTKGTDIQTKWIQNIVENYPLYNVEWLITGKGKMIKHEQPLPETDSDIRVLEKEIIALQKKIIQLQEENTRINAELATKSNKYTSVRATPGKLIK